MDTKDSLINRAMGRQIRAEKAGMLPEPTVDELADSTGLSVATINRTLSAKPRDIHVTAIARFATVFGLSPQELVRRAVERAGGLEALVSDAPPTTDPFTQKRIDKEAEARAMTPDQLDQVQQRAATTDPELEQDEPPTT